MCFTPAISLTTAIIEFIIATFILLYFRKSLVNKFFAVFVYLLGFYQFTEFMMCISGMPALWAKIGFITYTFLPATGLYFIIRIINQKKKGHYLKLLYLPPIIFSLMALLSRNFVLQTECSKFFVNAQRLLSASFPAASIIYGIYYAGFIVLIEIFLLGKILIEKNKTMKKIQINIFAAVIISLVPALILISVLPSLAPMFPSVYCEFALLFSVAALIAAHLDSKLKN